MGLFWRQRLKTVVWILHLKNLRMIGFLHAFLQRLVMGIKRLDHVNFVTYDPQATIAFYCDVIGLSLGNKLSI